MTKFQIELPIQKLSDEDDSRRVFGFASIVEKDGKSVVDLQDEIIPSEELEKAAYGYVLEARVAGERHERKVGTLIESVFLSKEKQDALGIDLGKVGWWVGFHIDDDSAWKAIKSGEYASFSIGGFGEREESV